MLAGGEAGGLSVAAAAVNRVVLYSHAHYVDIKDSFQAKITACVHFLTLFCTFGVPGYLEGCMWTDHKMVPQ